MQLLVKVTLGLRLIESWPWIARSRHASVMRIESEGSLILGVIVATTTVSLRKGNSRVYLRYAASGDSINALDFAASVRDGDAILSFKLRPVDDNERSDFERLVDEPLHRVDISDAQICRNLASFCRAHWTQGLPRFVEILGAGKPLILPAVFEEDGSADSVRILESDYAST